VETAARRSARRAAGGTPVPTSPGAHPLGARAAAVLKRAEVAEDGVGCDFRRVGSLAVSPQRAQRRQRRSAARSAALPKHSQVVGNAFFSCNG